MDAAPATKSGRVVGRYCLYDEIASGGMAAVHLGRLVGPVGFARTVAIKQLHAHFAKDPEFVAMFLDEARIAARIHHPNVVPTLDVIALENEVFLVMEYVHGESLFRLVRATQADIPPNIMGAIAAGALYGLHAAHEARNERGEQLEIVHRDVSPQNIIVGSDGVPRVLDFGVAKAIDRAQSTQDGSLKGKLRYMAPEQVQSAGVSRRTDVYAMAVVMHEMLTKRSLFYKGDAAATMNAILYGDVPAPSTMGPSIPSVFDEIVLKGLARDPANRYPDARTMALAIEEAVNIASPSRVAAWVADVARDALASRLELVSRIENDSALTRVPTPPTELVPVGPVGPPSSGTMLSAQSPVEDPTVSGSGVVPSRVSFTMPSAVPPAPPQPSRLVPMIVAGSAVLLVAGVALIMLATRSHAPAETKTAVAPPPPPSEASAEPPPAIASSAPAVDTAAPSAKPSAIAATSAKPVVKTVKTSGPHGRPDDDVFRTRK